jgi:hypothetical protein
VSCLGSTEDLKRKPMTVSSEVVIRFFLKMTLNLSHSINRLPTNHEWPVSKIQLSKFNIINYIVPMKH